MFDNVLVQNTFKNRFMSDSTLRKVAERAGVSVSTASQALNNKPNVAPETRARVLEAAIQLGYQQQVRIASPMTSRLSVVGMLTKEMPDNPLPINPFYSHVLAGVERECQRQNLSLMFANVEVDSKSHPLAWPPMLLDNRADGLLLVGTSLDGSVEPISRHLPRPIVLVDAYAPAQLWDSVIIDNVNGAHKAVSYLIEHGHTHIGMVGGSADGHPSVVERRKGYTRALKRHGISTLYFEDSHLIREAGYAATLRLLRRAPHITAIFACNDMTAMGVLAAARDLGRRVPEDLSLVGFDDIDLAREIHPALTTVQVDKVLMGTLAVRHLRDRAEEPQRTPVTSVLSTRLIVRDSVCPPTYSP
jgi:LacI family transcriptional regulator